MIGVDRTSDRRCTGSRPALGLVARAAIALFAAVALLAAGANAARAATITLSVGADPAEEQSMPITVSGVSDMQSTVSGYIRPAGDAPCGTWYIGEIEAGGQDAIVNHFVGSGPYSFVQNLTVPDPGDYRICAYLGTGQVPEALTSVSFTVRSNRASVAIDAPATVVPNQAFVLTLRGATEITRRLVIHRKPAGGTACGGASSTDVEGSELLRTEIQGAYSVPVTQTLPAGAYLFCAWVQESSSDLNPEASFATTISVQPPSLGLPLFAAKLEIAGATVLRSSRRLSVLAPITARASGNVNVAFQAAGITDRFTAPIDSARRRVLINRALAPAQARLGTGILTLSYGGDSDTQPQEVRLRAASRPANLKASRPTITGDKLSASGQISLRARGVVRLQLLYEPPGDTTTQTLELVTTIKNGRYQFNESLPAELVSSIAARRGVVHSYTLFTGYFPNRVRGEMSSFQVLGLR